MNSIPFKIVISEVCLSSDLGILKQEKNPEDESKKEH
jgi:hypothetical protein